MHYGDSELLTCDLCGYSAAEFNYQKLWGRYRILPGGAYVGPEILREQEVNDTESLHLCTDCATQLDSTITVAK